jgi:hypothetical protein
MASEKKGGKRKRWYEQLFPENIQPAPVGGVMSKFRMWVVRKASYKKAGCRLAKPGECPDVK